MDRLPPILYHATPSGNVRDILRHGLVPQDRSSSLGSDGIHLNRVFLSKFDDPRYMNLPADKVDGAVVLAVDTSYIDTSRLYPDDSIYGAYFNDQLENADIGAMFPTYYRKWGASGSTVGFGEWMDDANNSPGDDLESLLAGRFGLTIWNSGGMDAPFELGEVGYEGRIPPEAIEVAAPTAALRSAAFRVAGQYLYHATLADNLLDIAMEGLDPAHGGANFSGGPNDPSGWVEGKLFLSTDPKKALYYGENAMAKLWDYRKTPPVLLRVPSSIETESDQYGDVYTEDVIQPSSIEVEVPTFGWGGENGKEWVATGLEWQHLTEEMAEEARDIFSGDYLGRDKPLFLAPDFSPKAASDGHRVELTENDRGGVTAFLFGMDGDQVDEAYADIHMGVADDFQGNEGQYDYFNPNGPIEESGTVAVLTGLELPEELRGRGIGREMVEAASRWALSHGAEAVYAHSVGAPNDPDPEGFYESLGFEAVERDSMGNPYMRLGPARTAAREPGFLKKLRDAGALPSAEAAAAAVSSVMGGTLIHNAAGSTGTPGEDLSGKIQSILDNGLDPAYWAKPWEGSPGEGHPQAVYLSLAWESILDNPPPNYLLVEPRLSKPLVLLAGDADGNYAWGPALNEATGKSGAALSSFLRARGYDSVITIHRYGVGEVAYFGKKPLPASLPPETDRTAHLLGAAAEIANRSAAVGDIYRGVKTVIEKYGGKGLFARFSDVPKIGIRPSTEHHDPYGVYFYPVDWLAENAGFGTTYINLPYITVAKVKRSGWLNLATIRPPKARELAEKGGVLEEYEARTEGKGLNQVKGGRAGKRLWDAVEAKVKPFESDANKMEWNRIFGRMGVRAIYDPGTGSVNTAEPSQIVVLDLSLIEVVDVVDNKEDRKSVFHAVLKAVADEVLDDGWLVSGSHAEGGISADGTVSGQPVAMSVLPAKSGFDMEVTLSYHDPSGRKRRIVSRGRMPNEWEDAPADYLSEGHVKSILRSLGEADIGSGGDEDAEDMLDAALRSLTKLRLPDLTVEEGDGGAKFWKNTGDGKIEGSLKMTPGGGELELYAEDWLLFGGEDSTVIEIGPMRVSWEGDPSSATAEMSAELSRAVRELRVTGDVGEDKDINRDAAAEIVRMRTLSWMFPDDILEASGQKYEKKTAAALRNARLRVAAQQYWHGSKGDNIRMIAATGFVNPGVPEGETGGGYQKPMPGRTYATTDLGYALIYAIGAAMVGEELPDNPRFDGEGGVVSLEATGDLLPDEDWVGELIADCESVRRRLRGDPNARGGEVADWKDGLYAELRRRLPARTVSMIDRKPTRKLDEMSTQSMIGKNVNRWLLDSGDEAVRAKLVHHSPHHSHSGKMRVTGAWVFNKREVNPRLRKDGSNFIALATEIPVAKPVIASECPYGDYQSYSCSPGGVRMPPRVTPDIHDVVSGLFGGACTCPGCRAEDRVAGVDGGLETSLARAARRVAMPYLHEPKCPYCGHVGPRDPKVEFWASLPDDYRELLHRHYGTDDKQEIARRLMWDRTVPTYCGECGRTYLFEKPASTVDKVAGQFKAWHGTSTAHLDEIREAGGLMNPYLAATPALAMYYAEVAAEENGGEEILLEVDINDRSRLRYDGNAMDEPVTVGVSEDDRDAEWDRAAEEHPEWYAEATDTIAIPPEGWGYSWRGAHSVWYDGLLPLADIGGDINITASAPTEFRGLSDAVRSDITENLHDAFFAGTDVSREVLRGVLEDMDTPLRVGRLAVADLATQARTGRSASDTAIAHLTDALRRVGDLDPVLMDGDDFYDGGHRVLAYEAEGRETIPTVDIGPLLSADWETEFNEEIPGLARPVDGIPQFVTMDELSRMAATRRYWHGTTAGSMRSIEAIGRLRAPVYLTDSPAAAKEFAEMASDDARDRPLVLEVMLPEDRIDRLRPDTGFDGAPGNFISDEDIPLEWIPWYPDPEDPDPTIASILSTAASRVAAMDLATVRGFLEAKWVGRGRPEPGQNCVATASFLSKLIPGGEVVGGQPEGHRDLVRHGLATEEEARTGGGYRDDEGYLHPHLWVEAADRVYDLTADQFGGDPVTVTEPGGRYVPSELSDKNGAALRAVDAETDTWLEEWMSIRTASTPPLASLGKTISYDAELYHGTSLAAAAAIAKDGFHPDQHGEMSCESVSLSRNPVAAEVFAGGGVVFEFDITLRLFVLPGFVYDVMGCYAGTGMCDEDSIAEITRNADTLKRIGAVPESWNPETGELPDSSEWRDSGMNEYDWLERSLPDYDGVIVPGFDSNHPRAEAEIALFPAAAARLKDSVWSINVMGGQEYWRDGPEGESLEDGWAILAGIEPENDDDMEMSAALRRAADSVTYYYHGSAPDDILDIAQWGLLARDDRDGVSVTSDAGKAKSWAGLKSGGRDIEVFRIPASALPDLTPEDAAPAEPDTDFTTTARQIPPERLEIMRDGSWTPLLDIYGEFLDPVTASSRPGYPTPAWVRSQLRNGIPRVRHRVLDAFIVGSEAKGVAGPDSDLDIAVVIPPVRGKSALQFSERYHASRTRLPEWNGRPVDIQFFYPDDPELAGYDKLPLGTAIRRAADPAGSDPVTAALSLAALAVSPPNMVAYRAEDSGRGVMADAMPGGTYFFPRRETAELWAGDRGTVVERTIDTGTADVQNVPEGEMTRGDSDVIIRRDPDGSGEVLEIVVFDGSLISASLSKAARALGEHLGDTVTAYRALGAEHAEKVMREGFTGSHHAHGVYYTASPYRAMFYARFMASSDIRGVIFELEADSSRSQADVNDTTEWQSDALYEEVKSAAGDMVETVHGNTEARLWDSDAARSLESWLGGLTVSEGFYESPTQHPVWQLLADETKGTDSEMTISEARDALPPGRYGGMTVLDSRGVAGIDAGEMDGQAQAKSQEGIPADRLKAVWLPTALLDAAGEKPPADAETMRDHVDVIPAKFDEDYDIDFVSEIERQRDEARDGYDSDPPKGMDKADEDAWYAGLEAVSDELDSILGRWRDEGDSTMPGHIYSKLITGEKVTPEDLDREDGFVRYPLPEGRLAATNILRKAMRDRRPAEGKAARRAVGDVNMSDDIVSALRRAAENMGWSEDSDVDPDSFVDDGFVEDESGHAFWGSQGSGLLFVRNHPEDGRQLLLVKRSSQVEEPNTWGTTGGAVPKGENNLFASAVRETREEIGNIPPYNAVRQYVWKAPGGSFTYTTFILESTDAGWLPDDAFNWEATAAKWVSLEDAASYDLHFGLEAILSNLGESIFPATEDDA